MKKQSEFEKISEALFSKLKYIKEKNSQLIVLFSGIPGSGKSYISRKLEEKYHAIRIDNDLIRDIIYHSGNFSLSDKEAEELLQDYNEYFIRNYPFSNKLLILDKSMDRQYKRFFPIFEELRLKYLVIRLDMNKDEAIKRIMKRKGENLILVKESMERWQKEFEDFGKYAHYDVLLSGLHPDFNKIYKIINL